MKPCTNPNLEPYSFEEKKLFNTIRSKLSTVNDSLNIYVGSENKYEKITKRKKKKKFTTIMRVKINVNLSFI